jgi:hypothetical protein
VGGLYAEGGKLVDALEKAPNSMNHVVLLGDSILDNGAYVAGGSPLVEQLRFRLHGDWRVTLLARDGAVAEYVLIQLQQLPAISSQKMVAISIKPTRQIHLPKPS